MAYFSVNIYDLLRGMKETIQYCRWNSHSPAVDWKSQTTEYNVWMRWNCQIFSLLFPGFDRTGGEKGGGRNGVGCVKRRLHQCCSAPSNTHATFCRQNTLSCVTE